MATTQMAAVTAAVFAGLLVGDHLGDHVIQTNAAARAKATPTDDRLAAGANPWTGWSACLQHVASTVLTQAAALALVAVAAPLTAAGAIAALTVSAATHAVIDRRWIVRAIIRAKRCYDWEDGPYLIDQSLHHGAHLSAAVVAATATTVTDSATVSVAAVTLVVAALIIERRRAKTAAGRIGDQFRL